MVDSFLKYLRYEKRYSEHTLTAYEKDLEQFTQFLQETFEIDDLTEVKHPHLRSWIVELMEAGIAPGSINRKIAMKQFKTKKENM